MQEFIGRVEELEQLNNMFTRGDARVVDHVEFFERSVNYCFLS